MDWRGNQTASRHRYLAKFDAAEVDQYDAWVGRLSCEDEEAYLADLLRVFPMRDGMAVLDVGAGTGTLCRILSRAGGLVITALEPAPAMVAKLKSKPELHAVLAVEGFCDAQEDRRHFAEAQFDVIASRQVANGLFDPLTAFRNWYYWLKPGGTALVIDGLYGRDAWTGKWEEEVDLLPLSACQSTAMVPYLLEQVGFGIEAVSWMAATNARPSTRTTRYVVVARKPV
jgi:SAM-dependent methyltransferase